MPVEVVFCVPLVLDLPELDDLDDCLLLDDDLAVVFLRGVFFDLLVVLPREDVVFFLLAVDLRAIYRFRQLLNQ